MDPTKAILDTTDSQYGFSVTWQQRFVAQVHRGCQIGFLWSILGDLAKLSNPEPAPSKSRHTLPKVS